MAMATFTGVIGTGSKWLLDKIVGAIAATGINPNLLTFLGLVVNFIAAAFFAVAQFRGIQLAQLLYGGDDVMRVMAAMPSIFSLKDSRVRATACFMRLKKPDFFSSGSCGSSSSTTSASRSGP